MQTNTAGRDKVDSPGRLPSMRSKTELAGAFAATDYRVEHGGRVITLHLGEPPPSQLVDWIVAWAGSSTAWLITGCNPGAEMVSRAENEARCRVLGTMLNRSGVSRLPAVNHDPKGLWPDEPGWLVAGLEEGMARNLARRFGQAAIVAVRAGDANLIWLENPPSAPGIGCS